jgi:DNA-binding transcriptional LysR family regulator
MHPAHVPVPPMALHLLHHSRSSEKNAGNACTKRMYDGRMPATPRRRPRPIALAGLRGFEAAARHLSFTLAAAELHLTQSSVSRQIAALERQVGKPLFVRRTRALELTPAGERLHAAVRRALVEVDRTVAQLRGTGAAPRVTITTYASFASLWLGPRLAAFQRDHPGIDIRIDASDQFVDLARSDVDVAIRVTRGPAGAETLLEEEANAALSPRLLAALPDGLRTPQALGRLPLIEPDDTLPSAQFTNFDAWCEANGLALFNPPARLYFTYIDQSVQATARGQGAAIVRTPFLDELVASGDLVVPFPQLRMRTGYRYSLLVNPGRADLPHVAAFRDWLVAEFRRGPVRRT